MCEYIVIYDYLNDTYYGTKINNRQIYGRYKIGIIRNTDPKHLSKIKSTWCFRHVLTYPFF